MKETRLNNTMNMPLACFRKGLETNRYMNHVPTELVSLMVTFLRSDAQNLIAAKVIENSLVMLANVIVGVPKKKAFDKLMVEVHRMKDIQTHKH